LTGEYPVAALRLGRQSGLRSLFADTSNRQKEADKRRFFCDYSIDSDLLSGLPCTPRITQRSQISLNSATLVLVEFFTRPEYVAKT